MNRTLTAASNHDNLNRLISINKNMNCPNCGRKLSFFQKNCKRCQADLQFSLNKRKSFTRTVLLVVLAVLIYFAWTYYYNPPVRQMVRQYVSERAVELSEPHQVSFAWRYGGRDYELRETYYKSMYDSYHEKNKQYEYYGELPDGWEEEYYSLFFRRIKNDDSIAGLAQEFLKLQKENNLSDDELAELVAAFVQDIEYDEELAARIFTNQEEDSDPRFPYEVLYDNEGVCSGKSFLGAALLEELGYGTALLEFETYQHLALGIQCPRDVSFHQTGYCFVETTVENNPIAVIPEFDEEKNRAKGAVEEKAGFQRINSQEQNAETLGEFRIFRKTQGKQYTSAEKNIAAFATLVAIGDDIYDMEQELKVLEEKSLEQEKELESLKNESDSLLQQDRVSEYNALVPVHNNLLEEYEQTVAEHNSLYKEYEEKIDEYNLIVSDLHRE